MTDDETETAIRAEGRLAVDQAQQYFDQVGDRLSELHRRCDDEEALEAFREVEDLVMEFDDAMYEARQVFDDD